MFSSVISAAINGIDSRIVSVETDVSDGLPCFSMVGYLASEVREAQDRVRTALRNSGYRMMPKRITVNLSPGDIRKSGSGFDLPIAISVLASYGYIAADLLRQIFFAGELGLDGSIHAIHGVLGMVMEAKKAGCTSCIIPKMNAPEGSVIQGIDVYGAECLCDVVNHLVSTKKLKKATFNIEEKQPGTGGGEIPDFADIKGQRMVKRAAEIAAAGMHNLLITGPPGSGKTMIARRIPYILPPMDLEESLEISQIHSVAGILPEKGILTERPFRMPHHTISAIALCGGGAIPKPGEISLAHRGVLYLDELPEFQRETLEILRQPMEEGVVRISRNSGCCEFPADFMLVASRNPCKCGFYPTPKCHCSEGEVMRYYHRISRPLLDRIDLHAESEQIQYHDLVKNKAEECTSQIRERVMKAHRKQKERYKGSRFRFNSELVSSALEQYCPIAPEAEPEMQKIYARKNLTARSYHRLIKVARTIADLDESEYIEKRHLCEAVLYRPSFIQGE